MQMTQHRYDFWMIGRCQKYERLVNASRASGETLEFAGSTAGIKFPPHAIGSIYEGNLAGAEGFEPSPSSLTVRCPTSWTTPHYFFILACRPGLTACGMTSGLLSFLFL